MSYDNTNRGQLWGSKDKQKDTDRDFQGSINIEGVEYWLSGWRRTSDNPNAPALKLSVTKKESKAAEIQENLEQQAAAPVDDFDDEIPF